MGSLAFMFLLLSSVMFYYRRRKTATCGTSAGYLPAAVNDLEHFQQKTPGILWSDGHWEACDSEKESQSLSNHSHKQLLNTSPSLATEYSYADPAGIVIAPGSSGGIAYGGPKKSKLVHQPSFESPYATSNVIFDPEKRIKVCVQSLNPHKFLETVNSLKSFPFHYSK